MEVVAAKFTQRLTLGLQNVCYHRSVNTSRLPEGTHLIGSRTGRADGIKGWCEYSDEQLIF